MDFGGLFDMEKLRAMQQGLPQLDPNAAALTPGAPNLMPPPQPPGAPPQAPAAAQPGAAPQAGNPAATQPSFWDRLKTNMKAGMPNPNDPATYKDGVKGLMGAAFPGARPQQQPMRPGQPTPNPRDARMGSDKALQSMSEMSAISPDGRPAAVAAGSSVPGGRVAGMPSQDPRRRSPFDYA
jgi:hypothetical protein